MDKLLTIALTEDEQAWLADHKAIYSRISVADEGRQADMANEPSFEITRAELIELLALHGCMVTDRTLAYWEETGIFERPVRRWNNGVKAFYPRSRVIEVLNFIKSDPRRSTKYMHGQHLVKEIERLQQESLLLRIELAASNAIIDALCEEAAAERDGQSESSYAAMAKLVTALIVITAEGARSS